MPHGSEHGRTATRRRFVPPTARPRLDTPGGTWAEEDEGWPWDDEAARATSDASEDHDGVLTGAKRASGEPPRKFVFLAAATRYAIDFLPPDEVTDWAPEDPDDPGEPDDAFWDEAIFGAPEQEDRTVTEVVAPVAPKRRSHHGGRKKHRKLHAARRPSRAARRSPRRLRRAAAVALALGAGVSAAALALRGPAPHDERLAAGETTSEDASANGASTTGSTVVRASDLPAPLTDATAEPTTTTQPATTTSTTRPAPTTTMPRPTTTTAAPATSAPWPTTTWAPPATTTTTRPATTTTTTTAPTTTTTASTTTTTTTTTAPETIP